MLKRRTLRILTIIVAASILILSLVPNQPQIPGGFHLTDKIAHFIAYLSLSFLVIVSYFEGWRSERGGSERPKRLAQMRRTALAAFVVVAVSCVLFGGLIEFLQRFTGRLPELWDLAADVLGAAGGAALGLAVLGRIRRPESG